MMTCSSFVHWYVTAQASGFSIIRLLWFRLSAHLSGRYARSRSTPLSSLVCQLKHPTRPGITANQVHHRATLWPRDTQRQTLRGCHPGSDACTLTYSSATSHQPLTRIPLSTVPLALNSLLQSLLDPCQTIHPRSLHTHLPIEKVFDMHIHHHGLSHHCRIVDGAQWIPLLHSCPRLLECQLQAPRSPLSPRRSGVVRQCSYADLLRCGHSHSSYATAVKVASAVAAEDRDYACLWCGCFVSISSPVIDR